MLRFTKGYVFRGFIYLIETCLISNQDQFRLDSVTVFQLMEHTVAGLEDLCGQWSHYYWKDK